MPIPKNDLAALEIKSALEGAIASVKNADFTTGSGGYGYDLIGAAALLRLETPWTDQLPRQKSDTGLTAQWWEFMLSNGRWNAGSNVSGTAEEGKRGGQIGWSGSIRTAAFKSLALDARVTDEARLTTGGIIDPLALNQAALLLEVKRAHHIQNLVGRSGFLLGTANTPTVAAVTSGGYLADATYYVYVLPINGSAWQRTRGYSLNGSWAGSASTGTELVDFDRTNGDAGTTPVKGGTGIVSSVGSAALSGGSGAGALSISWAPLKGAVAYAVFIGTASGIANAYFQGVTNTCKYTQTAALKTAGQVVVSAFSSDNSEDPLEYDGLLTLLLESGSPAQYVSMPNGASLSSAANGQLDQLDVFLSYFSRNFDGYGPEDAWTSPTTRVAIEKAIMSNASASRVAYLVNTQAGGNVTPTGAVTEIRNPYTGTMISLKSDPYIPDGKIILSPRTIPSRVSSKVTTPVFFRAQQEFYGEAWPRTTRSWSNGVSLVGALCTPWRAGFAVLDNVPLS